ncbi:MAG: hypothetical protein U0798_15385 [Gemmataceae bacterium]
MQIQKIYNFAMFAMVLILFTLFIHRDYRLYKTNEYIDSVKVCLVLGVGKYAVEDYDNPKSTVYEIWKDAELDIRHDFTFTLKHFPIDVLERLEIYSADVFEGKWEPNSSETGASVKLIFDKHQGNDVFLLFFPHGKLLSTKNEETLFQMQRKP